MAKVLIVNEGPENITVTMVDKLGKQVQPLTLIKPNESKPLFVTTGTEHDRQLIIKEIK